MNAVVRRSSIGVFVLLFSKLSKVRRTDRRTDGRTDGRSRLFLRHVQTRTPLARAHTRSGGVMHTRDVYCRYHSGSGYFVTQLFPFNCIARPSTIAVGYTCTGTMAIIESVALVLRDKSRAYICKSFVQLFTIDIISCDLFYLLM